jgi:hypothetical protein
MNSKAFINTIQIINLALILGIINFMIISLFLGSGELYNESRATDPSWISVFYWYPTVSLMIILVAIFIYRHIISKISIDETLGYKLKTYRNAFLIRATMTELVSLMGIVFYILINNPYYIVFSIIFMSFFIIWHPTKNKIIQKLPLSIQEIQQIEDPEYIIG